jgi:serine/threonine protein kinase
MALAARHRELADALAPSLNRIRLLRTGARFTILAAQLPGSDRQVVVKVPNEGSSTWLWDVLAHEAAALTAIGPHPNIVALVQQIDLDAGQPALVFERCTGSWADTLHGGGTIPLREVVSVGIKLAGALETVHAAGYIHCDVRPDNVLVGSDGRPVLAGFDEAVEADLDDPTALHVTTQHTAPELLEGRAPTPATDVYGLAATLYELVAGRAAFRAYAGESPASVIVRVLSGHVKPIVAAGIPLDMSDLLTWALSGDPAQRPPTPAWLAEELRRIERRQGWPRTNVVSA